jgi:FkbM family methyltransferase
MLASFKKKFIKTSLIYYIYRYFKYKFKSFTSYGGSGEDIFISKFFRDFNKGFYVDVGALHPINGSLTYLLYQKGWNGINIDMMQENLKLFNIFRKRDVNLDIAVSSSKGSINAYLFEVGSGVNTNQLKLAKKWKNRINKNFTTRIVKKNTLNNILKNYRVIKDFDFLNIDVEGHEFDVLKGLNLNKYRPKLISIEIHVLKTKEIFRTNIFKYLSKNNYELVSQYKQTSFFTPK